MLILLLLAAATAAPAVVSLTDTNFDDFVAGEKATLIEFYAPWCGHCKKMTAPYEAAAVALAPLRLGAVDATVSTKLAARFGVRGYPALLAFVDGKPADAKFSGARTTDAFIAFVRALAPAAALAATEPAVAADEAAKPEL